MKHKGLVVLPMALLLSVSAMSATAFADTPEKTISAETDAKETTEKETTEKEIQNEQSDDKSSEETAKTASDDKASKTCKKSRPEKKEEVAEPENAIGKDAAKQKALDDAGVTADQTGKVRSRVSKLDDGTVIYKVHFRYNGLRYSYQIDAATGKVLDKSSKEETAEDAAKRAGKHGGHGKKDAANSGTAAETSAASA